MTRLRVAHVLLVALAVLGLGWAVAPRSAPPLYDGVGFPDEPYRFVVPPAGAKTSKAPTAAVASVPVTDGLAGAAVLSTAEQAPQFSVLIPTGRLQAPAGTRRIVLHAMAVKPVSPPPGGHLWSNVYDLSATEPQVTLRDASPPATITLRAATAQRPYPTIERFTGSGWVSVKTVPVGNDIYQASLPALGRYAVVGTAPLDLSQVAGANKSAASRSGIVIFLVAVGVVLVLVLVGWRRRTARRPAEADEDEQTDEDEETVT